MQQINKALNSSLLGVVTGYHIKINLTTSVSVPLFALGMQYKPRETSETAYIYISMLMVIFLISGILSRIPVYTIINDTFNLSNDTNSQWFKNVFSQAIF